MAPCRPRARFSLPQDRGLTGKLEPVSPASPPRAEPDLELLPPRLSKEELIQSMDRVDREITMVEQQISKLKRKQVRRAPGWRPCAPGAAARAGGAGRRTCAGLCPQARFPQGLCVCRTRCRFVRAALPGGTLRVEGSVLGLPCGGHRAPPAAGDGALHVD